MSGVERGNDFLRGKVVVASGEVSGIGLEGPGVRNEKGLTDLII